MFSQMQDCYEFAFAAVDGLYGWFSEVIAIIFVVLVFNFFAKWILKKLHLHFEKTKDVWPDSFVQALYLPLSYYVWFFAFIHALDLVNHRVFEGLFLPSMHILLKASLVVASAWFSLRWKKNIVRSLIHKSKNKQIVIEASKIDVIDKLLTMLILFFTALLLMEVTNQNMNTLIAFGGVGGLAIAFASQEVVSNFFGGLMIYLTHPFVIGDWISIPEHQIEGYVEEIGWYMTRVRTFEKRPIYIPNSMFSKAVVMTPSRMSHRQINETFGIRYRDMPMARAIIDGIKEMLMKHPDIDRYQQVLVHLTGFGSYSVDILVYAYSQVIGTEGFRNVKQDILFKIYDIISAHGAEMAFPTTQLELPARTPPSAILAPD